MAMTLEIQGLVKNYGPVHVLRDISLFVESGAFVSLLGPSGCGKTTLLNAIAGTIDVDGGEIRANGEIWSRRGLTLPPELRRIGMVFQDFALWPHMTVEGNIAFPLRTLRMQRQEIAQRVEDVLRVVHMEGYERAYPHRLSGGQKQRVAMARAIAPRPSLLLMDEPLSSLDLKLREEMRWDLLQIVREAKITTIYVTHDQGEALSMSDHVVLLNQGRVVQAGSPKELYGHPRSLFAATFLGASNMLEGVVETGGDDRWTVLAGGLRLEVQDMRPPGATARVLIRPSHVRMLEAGAAPAVNSGLGRIRERAYLGSFWQYQVALDDAQTAHPIEVWSEDEWVKDQPVALHFPIDRLRVLAGD